ncbi:MAG: hypothetical protein WCK17_06535 [Verrucomicrobiota bacterium]
MKTTILALILSSFLAFLAASSTAQDGLFTSAQPPIVVRLGVDDGKVYFTNTGEKVLHGITMNTKDKDGKKSSKVIIDTIDPHKTVAIPFLLKLFVEGTTLTCTNYSKPLVEFGP